MNRIDREKQTVQKMIELYCHHRLKQDTIQEEYQQLIDYAHNRLSHCRFGENKPVCQKCPIHCYAPQERQKIREVMRWTGPRMMLYAPKATIIHASISLKNWLQALSFRTGVIVLLSCIPFYILSFAQMALPISVAAKGILWTILFGLAKTCQYGGLTILGVEGYKRFKNAFKRNKA